MSKAAPAPLKTSGPQFKSAWSNGPPRDTSASSTPRSQSPAPSSPAVTSHSRRPSTLSGSGHNARTNRGSIVGKQGELSVLIAFSRLSFSLFAAYRLCASILIPTSKACQCSIRQYFSSLMHITRLVMIACYGLVEGLKESVTIQASVADSCAVNVDVSC